MNWLDKNQNKILIAIWGFIFLTILIVILTEPVHAASPTDLPLTIGIPDTLSDLGLDSNVVDSVVSQYINILTSQYSFNPSDNYSVFVSDVADDGLVYIVATYNLSISATYSDYDYLFTYQNLSQHYVQFVYNSNTGSLSSGNFYGGWVNSWLFNSINLLNGKGWMLASVSDFPNYWVFPSEVPDTTGHAVPPINDQGHFIPNVNPQHPNINPYQPSSPQFPSIDTSTLETLVESLIDVTEYGFNYLGGLISGSFNNLLSNLGGWFDYIVDSFRQGFNNVVGTIQDLATDFYNNMASLFENVATFFNTLVSLGLEDGSFSFSKFLTTLLVPDSDDFVQLLLDGDIHHVIPLFSAIKTKFTSIFDDFYNLTPTKVFLIPSFTWHGYTYNLSIDFSWYDDYKVYGDTIITGFLIIGYIYWFVVQFNSMLRGGNSIGHDISKVGGKS